jgi:hypothetical protein
MVAVTRDFADRLAEVARLLKEDEVADETLRRLTDLGPALVPGATVRNASLYRACRRMADDLQAALESRAVIEQAKGILRAEPGPVGRLMPHPADVPP